MKKFVLGVLLGAVLAGVAIVGYIYSGIDYCKYCGEPFQTHHTLFTNDKAISDHICTNCKGYIEGEEVR